VLFRSAELDAAREEVDELRGVLRGRIWVGALMPAGGLDVPGLLARFSRTHPGIDVSLREGIAADMLRLLAAGKLDAAFCLLDGAPPPEFGVERLSEDEVVVAFAPDRGPAAATVGVAELAGHRIVATRRGSAITSAFERRVADAGAQLHLALESGDPFLLRSLAAQGFAAAVLPRSLTDLPGPALDVRSLDPPIHLPVALLWRRERLAPPAARTFIAFARA